MVSKASKKVKRRRKHGSDSGVLGSGSSISLRPKKVPEPHAVSLETLRSLNVFSTSQVARLCSVSDKTVKNWCDRGILESYRLPTGPGKQEGARRVKRAALASFLKANGMPLNGLTGEQEG